MASFMRAIPWARRFLEAFQPDIVHSHGFHGNIFARVLRWRGAAPAPISTIHNVYEGGRLRMLAYRLTDRCSAQTTAVSTAAAERFVKLKAVPADKCVVIPNGIDIDEFAPNPWRRKQTRRENGIDSEFVWLAAGRVAPAKDYPNLLRACALLREKTSDMQVWVAGEGSDEALEEMRSLAGQLKLSGMVCFLGLRRDMPALLDASDGFVLSSAWEGMPLAIAESMAMEKPVVATDVGGVRELIGDLGALVPAGDPRELAAAMERTMALPEKQRQALGQAARQRVAQSFSIDSRVADWEALYEKTMARKRK
jgi:glycosyltransferase involved in cell wall biosynthesis